MSDVDRESWEEYRQRLLDETSRFIEWGLAHPDEVVPIPCKPVGEPGFPRRVADWFWSTALCDGGSRMERWREKLMYAGMFLKSLK